MNKEQKQAIKERLEKLAAKNRGTLTPTRVVMDARDKSSPLHDFFEWDDGAAAQRYREQQARELIGRFKVEIRTTSRTIFAPAYIRDPRVDPDDQGYTTIAEIRDDAALAKESLMYELSRALSALDRAADIAASLGLGKDFADLLRRAKVIQDSLLTGQKPARKSIGAAHIGIA